jgi:hypothetical protein
MLKPPATTKNPTSRTKLFLATLKGLTRAILPATTAVMKLAAPMSSPTAKLPLCVLMAAKVLNTSGLPFPKAKNVTPAKLSLIPRIDAIVLRFIQRKSEAAMPMVEKSMNIQRTRMMKARGLALSSRQ